MSYVKNCLICGQTDIKIIPDNRDGETWACPSCEKCFVSGSAIQILKNSSTSKTPFEAYKDSNIKEFNIRHASRACP